ncbi:MAG TPA: carboxypeptidase-like regulatory domain-containing protein [Pirellulales bacterium]|nr:carboxypeptidase-like regulatory domain-containing protein [Pirellulales bacterium]
MRVCLYISLAACAALISGGCNKAGPALGTVPAGGTVTYKGQAVEGATVSLLPTAEGGKGASGVTDSNGRFQLKTYAGPTSQPAGAMPGEYRVLIIKPEIVSGPSAEGEAVDPGRIEEGKSPTEGKSLIPERYGNADTSGLTASVKPSGENNFPFELTD